MRLPITQGDMSTFSFTLPDGNVLTETNHFPTNPTGTRLAALPLVVAVHGGSYNADYFDLDDNHTVRHFAQALGIPVIAINRPHYGSSKLPPTPEGTTFMKQTATYMHRTILPFLWKAHASSLGVSSIFLFAHSIGGGIAVITASLHASDGPAAAYPLCGLSISGVGSNVRLLPMDIFQKDPQDLIGIPVRFPNDQKDILMLGSPSLYDPAVLHHTERLQHEAYAEEIYDINISWRGYWKEYAADVKVPVLYSLGEHDALWNSTDQDVKDFAAGFVNASTVESRRVLSAPHNIDHSLQGPGFLLRTLGFAVECAVYEKLVLAPQPSGKT